HLVSLATDLAFETDEDGRIVFVLPEMALGWPSGALTGQPADLLLADDGANDGFNPFRVTEDVRRRRCWLRRSDGMLAMMAVSASPVRDPGGTVRGSRVTAIEIGDLDRPPSAIGSRLRHGDVLDQVLTRVAQETEADRMMDVALWSMMHALDAEGAAVLAKLSEDTGLEVIHECGPGGPAIAEFAGQLLEGNPAEPRSGTNPDGRVVLTIACPSRFSATAGLAVWRAPGGSAWAYEESKLAA